MTTAAPTRTPEAAAGRAGLAAVLVLAVGTFATGTDAFVVAGLLPSIVGRWARRWPPPASWW